MRSLVRVVLAVAVIVAAVSVHVLAADNPFPLGKNRVPEALKGSQSLPSGLSFGYTYMNDMMDLSNFTFSLGGQPLPPGAIEVTEGRHKTSVYMGRFDTWVFPFLNVYAMAATIDGSASDVAFKVNPIPGMPPLPIPSTIEPSYTGHFYGIGMTLAAGYKQFFASYDINRQWATISIFETTVPAIAQGIRAGVHGKVNGANAAVYAGAFHLSLRDEVLTGKNFIPGLPDHSFSLVASPQSAWNMLVGGKIEVTRTFVVTAEAGLGTRKQFVIMPGVRF